MTRLRLAKVLRDLWIARGRVAMMIFAIALSVIAVGGFLSARAILTREISDNYLDTHPASAELVIPGGVTPDALAIARAQPGITAVAARASVVARIRTGSGQWKPLLLFVDAAGDDRVIATVQVEHRSLPAPSNGIVLERTALAFLGVKVGDTAEVIAPGGRATSFTISGSAHDGGVAPAEQEQTVYGYATTETMVRLGLTPTLDDLAIVVGAGTGAGAGPRAATEPSGDAVAIAAATERLGAALGAHGIRVDHIDIPKPLAHPHQNQMDTVSFTLLAFGLAALLLSSILVATILGGMIGAQTRQIGAMKALGATTGQVFGIYLPLAGVISVVATALAAAPGIAFGQFLARQGAALLNLDLGSLSVPPWVWLVEVAVGVLVPVLIALIPLARGAGISVRRAINDQGVGSGRAGRVGTLLARIGGLPRVVLLALRNVARRPGRLLLNLALLGVAAGMFLTGINTADAWAQLVTQGVAHRHDDLQVQLAPSPSSAQSVTIVRAIPGVSGVEAWSSAPITVHDQQTFDIASVYPDDAHGSFTMLAPSDNTLLALPLRSGRWLRPGDANAVVLNNLAAVPVPLAQVGQRVSLTVAGQAQDWTVVGIVSDFGSQATAYVTPGEFARATGGQQASTQLRIVTDTHTAGARHTVLGRVEAALDAEHEPVARAFTIDDLSAGLDNHVLVLADALMLLGLVMGLVGLLGLAVSLTTSVVERTREFGILRAIGATDADVRAIVVAEGLITTIVSSLLGIALAIPAGAALGNFIGQQAFRQPLPFQFTAPTVTAWVLIAFIGTPLATWAAANRATRLTVRQSLTVL